MFDIEYTETDYVDYDNWYFLKENEAPYLVKNGNIRIKNTKKGGEWFANEVLKIIEYGVSSRMIMDMRLSIGSTKDPVKPTFKKAFDKVMVKHYPSLVLDNWEITKKITKDEV